MKNVGAGLLVLLLKLGPKLYPLLKSLGDELLIFGKTFLGIGTAGTAAVSAGLYAYLFTWETGLGLIAFLIMHEYGHVWAMRKSGVATKGMYFIPFMGAVAIMDELVHSARNEAFISIMGPVFGLLLFVIPGYIVWYYTGSEAVAAVTALCCFVNLINLLPIMPLDGGRMLKSVGYSDNVLASLKLIVGISVVTAVVAMFFGFTLFGLMAVIGFIEICTLFGIHQFTWRIASALFRAFWVYIFSAVFLIGNELAEVIAMPWWQLTLAGLFLVMMIVLLLFDVFRFKENQESFWYALVMYPWRVLRDAVRGVKQLGELKREHVKSIENYVPMVHQAKISYTLITVTIVLIHFVVMFHLSGTTTGTIFTDMLK